MMIQCFKGFALVSLLFLSIGYSMTAQAEIVEKVIKYEHEGQKLQGYMYYDDTWYKPRPGVMVVHQWMGISDHEKGFAEALVEMGYVAFVVDIYGVDKRPQNTDEAKKIAGKFRSGDRALLKQRSQLGLKLLKEQKQVDATKTAALGFCFGGTAVLELARDGADTQGVISFHGNLHTPDAALAKNIKTKVLVCHGAIDPIVPEAEVNAFLKEMNDAKVDYQFITYANAVHAFTHENTEYYNRDAAERSFIHMELFLDEVFFYEEELEDEEE